MGFEQAFLQIDRSRYAVVYSTFTNGQDLLFLGLGDDNLKILIFNVVGVNSDAITEFRV